MKSAICDCVMGRFLVPGAILVHAVLGGDFNGVPLSDDIVQSEDFPDGNSWTGWSEWYGCSETTTFGVVTRPDISTKQGIVYEHFRELKPRETEIK